MSISLALVEITVARVILKNLIQILQFALMKPACCAACHNILI